MQKHNTWLLAVMLLVLTLSGCKGNGVEYRTEPAVRADLEETVTATGAVNPVATVLVGTQVSGTIKAIFVDFNSRVTKGQIIAQIDPEMFEAQAAQARANVLKAEAQARESERTLRRSRDLIAKDLIARSDLDAAETTHDANLALLEQAKAALRVAEANLRYTRILSPVDGIVISRSVDVGQTVAASFQTPTLFTIARDLTKMQINASVDEADIGKVKVGMAASFTVDAYPDEAFAGSVWQVRNAPTTVQNVVTYDVVVKVENRSLKLKPGMTANVSIVTASREGVLTVPNAALRFRPPDRERGSAPQKGQAVWVLEAGKLRRVAVTTGISNGAATEVLAGDLQEGRQVVLDTAKPRSDAARPQSPGPRMF